MRIPGGRLWDEFQVSVSKQTLGRELRAIRYRKLSARPRHHAEAVGAIEPFKKVPRHIGGDRARAWRRSQQHRNLVWRTSPASARRTRSPGAGPDGEPDP